MLDARTEEEIDVLDADQGEDARAVADIELMMLEARQLALQALLVPAGVARRTKEDRALVVVHAMDRVAELSREIDGHLGADQAGGAGDEESFAHLAEGLKEEG